MPFVKIAIKTILTQWVDCIGSVDDFINNCHPDLRNPQQPFFLSPCDLQAIRACGVTFVSSMVERVIEEFAKGQPDKSAEIRHSINKEVGDNLKNIVPGSEMAEKLKVILTRQGLWSQYLEVGIILVVIGGFSPFPYKITCIGSGIIGINIFIFIFFSLVSRFLRFFFVSFFVYKYGEKTQIIIGRYINIISLMFITLFVIYLIYL